jgi:hypothetical protein
MKLFALAALAATMPAFATTFPGPVATAFAAGAPDHLTNGCASLAVVLRMAMAQYGEAPAFVATAGTGMVIALTVNAKTGTWTMWGQREPDTMCLLTGGAGWQQAPDAVKQIAPAGRPS